MNETYLILPVNYVRRGESMKKRSILSVKSHENHKAGTNVPLF